MRMDFIKSFLNSQVPDFKDVFPTKNVIAKDGVYLA
jgi:hypothetical protein